MTYGNIYVAKVALGANDVQTVRTFLEAEAYNGPSLIIAYGHCINQGFDMKLGLDQQKKAVLSGAWPLFRYNPALLAEGKNPMQLDCKAPSLPIEQYVYNETRYKSLVTVNEEAAERLLKLAQSDVLARWKQYELLAGIQTTTPETK